ncbi:MAG: hypothetical protein QME58_11860 [Bacteroidota bacterium]|nr:hypothetical protein [Bacteroidota bacterium]
MKTFSIIFISLFLIISFVEAQVPQLVNYQGKLDSAGVPLSGTRNLTFKIYDVLTGGTAIWTETQTGATITNGVFNVILGSISAFSTATSPLFVGTGDRYIGITVGSGTEMTPRLRITSVAFSLRADQADGVADNAVTSVKILDGTVAAADLATNSVTTVKIADNAVTSVKILDGTIAAADLASNSVTTVKIADNAVTSAKIVDGTVTTADLADNSVSSVKIVDGTIAAADLASNSVTTVKIADNNVTAAKILDEPGVARGANTGSVVIANSGVTNITSASITVPGPGYIVALGHAFGQIGGTSIGNILVGIETANTTTPTQYIAFGANDQTFASSVVWWGSISHEKTFNITAAGSYTYYLNAFRGWVGGSASVWYSKLILMYFPTSYGTVTKMSGTSNENADQSPASGSGK